MSFVARGIGIRHADDALPDPQVALLEVLHQRQSSVLHKSLMQCLSDSVSAAETILKKPLGYGPGELSIRSSVELDLLQGSSFGLALFMSLVGSHLGIGLRSDIACTGRIMPNGTIAPVADIELKAIVRSDERILLLPKANEQEARRTSHGPRAVGVSRVEQALEIGLNTEYLVTHLMSGELSTALHSVYKYLDNLKSIGYLPRDLGPVVRLAYQREGIFASIVGHDPLSWRLRLLAFSSLSDPDPTNLLQSIFCDYEWCIDEADPNHEVRKETLVADLFKMAVQTQRPDLALDIVNLYLLSRTSSDVFNTDGPLRKAAMEVLSDVTQSNDSKALDIIFSSRNGLGRRILFAHRSEDQLRNELRDCELTTHIIHDNIGQLRLGRFRYSLGDRALDLSIESPMALLDSSSTVPCSLRRDDWNKFMDMMTSRPDGRLMLSHFTHQVFELNEFETKIHWKDGSGCWPPSIDTLHFLGDIVNHDLHILDSQQGRLLDLCCGTGVLGIALSKIGNAKDISFVDLEPSACAITKLNIENNFSCVDGWTSESVDKRILSESVSTGKQGAQARVFHVHECEATRFLLKEAEVFRTESVPYETVYFTPPYVPEPDLLGIPMWRAVGGTDLLEWGITNGHRFCRKLVLIYSSIAEHAVKRSVIHNQHIRQVSLIGEHWAALRIPGFVQEFEYIPDGAGGGTMTDRAKAYWNMYLSNMADTQSLSISGLVPVGGHGFKWAHKLVSIVIEFE